MTFNKLVSLFHHTDKNYFKENKANETGLPCEKLGWDHKWENEMANEYGERIDLECSICKKWLYRDYDDTKDL